MAKNENQLTYNALFSAALVIMAANVYWFGYPAFRAIGLYNYYVDMFFSRIAVTGAFSSSYVLRFVCVVMVFVCMMTTLTMKPISLDYNQIALRCAIGLAVFLFPVVHPGLYILVTVTGFFLMAHGFNLLGRKLKGMSKDLNNPYETFEQCRVLQKTQYSVNFRTKYYYNKRWWNGFINVINPFSGTIIFGVPGSGKSYSILYEYMIQLIGKHLFVPFVYDYKYPELTSFTYCLYLKHKQDFEKKFGSVEFYSINFMDPRYSYRINPLDPMYVRGISDAFETAEMLMRNTNPEAFQRGAPDFWVTSAMNYWAALIWFLHEYEEGRYCTFPHFIELLTYDRNDVLKVLMSRPELKTTLISFKEALDDKAGETVAGQVSTARQPLVKMANEELYWVMSKNEVSLDINNPKCPKFVCVGNFPERQKLYSTVLSLITGRMFPIINNPKKTPCAIFGDEIPTISMYGLTNLIATARSNRVATVLAAQDKAQLEQLWGREEAHSTLNIFGNHFYGKMIGDNVRALSDLFGSEYVTMESVSTGGDHTSVSISNQLRKRLPENRIATMSTGEFAAMVSDDGQTRVEYKQSCSFIQVDKKERDEIASHSRELPMFNRRDFNCESVEAHVMADQESAIVKYLTEMEIKRQKDEQRMEGRYFPIATGIITEDSRKRYEEMGKQERTDILKTIVDHEQKKEMNRILVENVNKIRADVERIFFNSLGTKPKASMSVSSDIYEDDSDYDI